mgnify:CR=1 FL=1
MAYTTIDDPTIYFNSVLYTGTGSGGSNRQITGVGFQPDWVWIKNRNSAQEHVLVDSIRGATKSLDSSANSAESTTSTQVGAFISDGFQLGSGSVQNRVNGSGNGLVAWNWKTGTSFTNDASATGIGTIDSTGSVNTDAGFSIISYTGTGSAGTVAHGLGAVPKMIIIKSRNTASLWGVYHQAIGNTHGLFLNATNAATSLSAYWNNTSPTSSVFSLGGDADINKSSDPLIAYCFADIKGYLKFGSYTGNGNADGTFVYTGFKPAFVLVKRTDTAGYEWSIWDNKRDSFNLADTTLRPNSSATESTIGSFYQIDMLSQGFKFRTSNVDVNASSASYIYMAFAESPFVNSNGVPNNAR